MGSYWLLVSAILVLSANGLLAEQYPFRVYDQSTGLANPTAQAMASDGEGFLWVGTANGLFRFDGMRFRLYDTTAGLPGNRITSLLSAPDGTLWVATETGLARRRGDHFETVDFQRKILTVPGSLLAWHSSAGLLFTSSEGLVAIRGQKHTWLRPRGAFGATVDSGGRIWFGCGKLVCRMDDWRQPGKVREYGEAEGLPPNRSWHALIEDRRGRVWARSTDGLAMYSGDRFQAVNLEAHTSALAGLYQDRHGRLLLPSEQGVWILEGERWRLIDSTSGLPMDATLSVTEDREGGLWIGTGAAGVARWLGDGNWTTYSKADGLPNASVWHMLRDRRGRWWAGTQNGLVRYPQSPKAGDAKVWRRKEGLPNIRVLRLAEDPGGHVWVASGREIARVDAITDMVSSYGFGSGGAFAVHVDRAGWVWAAGFRALARSRWDEPGFEPVELPGAGAGTWYFDLFEAPDGRLWVATSVGLYVRDLEGKWRRYTEKEGLRSNAVASVTQDAQGQMVVSYREAHGISMLTANQWRHWDAGSQLNSLKVHFVRRAGEAIWVGTDRGVDILEAGRVRHMDSEAGLAWNDTNSGALLPDPDGTVWVGTTRGVSRYRPARRPLPPAAPPVRIVAVRFGGRVAQAGAPLSDRQLSYRQRPAEFELAALSFDQPGLVRLEYRLTNSSGQLDEPWREAKQGLVVFSSLPAGKYHFEARARGANGIWSRTPATYDFELLPPWWQTGWATALFLSAALGLVRFFLYWRMRVVLSRQRKLEQAVVERTARIQEQKGEIEALLVQTQAMSRHKTEFLANMSHEIRTPLNGVLGMSRLIGRTNLDAEQREYVDELETSTRWLTTMLNDILDYAKAEAGTLEFESVAFRPRLVVEECQGIFAPVAAAQKLDLRTVVEGDTLVLGDPGRLRQILSNLLNNAVKFTPSGSIELRARFLPETNAHRAAWEFSVTDTGIGIPLEKQRQVFEAFRQADGSLTRRFGGSGLGLALCTKLARVMGTELELESEEGKGSRFFFRVPLPLAPAPPKPDGPLSLPPLCILLAEDNRVNQKVASRLLEKLGHRVIIANNGVEAVDRFQEQRFDAVLMDIHMPEMDGFEATRRISAWQRQQGSEVPVIALTARNMQGDRDEAAEAGMVGYLSKPLELQDLLVMLARHTQAPVNA
ncbi:MAG: response regulator [Bryobacteraceae bacterium]|nr:response regulator [Bryobacteraceae bacterium]